MLAAVPVAATRQRQGAAPLPWRPPLPPPAGDTPTPTAERWKLTTRPDGRKSLTRDSDVMDGMWLAAAAAGWAAVDAAAAAAAAGAPAAAGATAAGTAPAWGGTAPVGASSPPTTGALPAGAPRAEGAAAEAPTAGFFRSSATDTCDRPSMVAGDAKRIGEAAAAAMAVAAEAAAPPPPVRWRGTPPRHPTAPRPRQLPVKPAPGRRPRQPRPAAPPRGCH